MAQKRMFKAFAMIFHGVILSIGVFAIYDFLFSVETNDCEMTYMFENPRYLKIKMDRESKKLYPGYSLYYYTEGHRGLQFGGTPALFIPGNAGSYKQVRSIGSVTLRVAESMKISKYDFFTIDFQEELSALFGSLLKRQTNFTSICIRHILSLYEGRHKSIVIVGHSMGGLIARALFALNDFDHSTVSVVITQATPHKRPVLLLDASMKQFYKDTNDAWRRMSDKIYLSIKKGKDPQQITLVSTAGGDRDLMVPTDLTGLSWIGHHHHAVWTSTASMPRAWVSTDHLCHVWCKQVVMATARALYDIINPLTNQISANSTMRYEVMKYHFVANYGDYFQIVTPPSRSIMVNTNYKFEFVEAPWRHSGRNPQSRYVAINLEGLKDTSRIMIITSGVDVSDWIGACSPNTLMKTCTHLKPLLSQGFLLPNPKNSPFKVVQLLYEQLKPQQYVVLYLSMSHYNFAMVNIYQPEERVIKMGYDSFIDPSDSLKSSSYLGFWQSHELTLKGPSFYSLHTKSLGHLDVYEIRTDSLQCTKNDDKISSVMMFINERKEYPTYSAIRNGSASKMRLKLASKAMEIPIKLRDVLLEVPSPKVNLYLVSNCTFKIELFPTIPGMLGQVARMYVYYMPSLVTAASMVKLGWQFSGKRNSLNTYISPVVIFTMVTMITNHVGLDQLLKMKHEVTFIREWDWAVLLALFIFSMSFSCLLGSMASLSSKIFSCILYPLMKVSAKVRSCFDTFSRVTFLLLCFSPVISHISCGSVVLFIVMLAYSGKAIQQELKLKLDLSKSEKPIPFAFASTLTSIYLLSFFHFLLNFPTLVIWLKDIHKFHLLNDDPSFVHSCISGIVFCWLQLMGYLDSPIGRYSTAIWLITLVISSHVILYGMITLYRISYFLDALLLILAAHSMTHGGRKTDG